MVSLSPRVNFPQLVASGGREPQVHLAPLHFHRSGWWPVMTCLQRRKVSIFPWPTFEYLYWGLISINISSNCHMNICINALAQKSQQTKNEQMKMALINEKEESGLDVDFSGQLRSTFIEKLTSSRNFLLLFNFLLGIPGKYWAHPHLQEN